MNAVKRRFAVAVLGGLTVVAGMGCHWQLQRYRQSRFRWDRIEGQLRLFQPQQLPDLQLLRRNNTPEWEYLLVAVYGRFLDHTRWVLRASEGRLGYFMLQLFETQKGERIFVNRGWVPQGRRGDSALLAPTDSTEIYGILKKDESWEVDEKQRRTLQRGSEEHLIDLERLALGQLGVYTGAYIERMLSNTEKIGELYPFPSSIERYARPYLTPRRHLEYSFFWGTCTGFGLLYIIKLLR